MDHTPLVSIIMPFLNGERFVQEAVESVFAQTCNDWELLLVDDGSTDASTEITRRYSAEYPGQVRYLEHPSHQNRGSSASRNLGISSAKGKYIAFLDHDDIWLPEKLKQQIACLEYHREAAMVYGPVECWYSWTGNPNDTQRDFIQQLGVRFDHLVQPPGLLPIFLRNGGAYTPCTCSALVRLEVAKAVGGFEDAFRTLYDDQCFFSKICLTAPVFVESMYWCKYRQHPASTCAVSTKAHRHSARYAFLTWLENYLFTGGCNDRDVWRILRTELRRYQQRRYQHRPLYRLTKLAQRYIRLLKGQ